MTGSSGFIGRHVARLMTANGFYVAEGHYDITSFDDSTSFAREIADGDFLLHLAGLSSPQECELDPKLAYEVNVMGTELLCEALLRTGKSPHLLLASSAHVYAPAGGVLSEESPVRPINTYGRTKRAAEILVRDWSQINGCRATVLRLFNHSHVSQPPHFFLPSLYKKITAIPATPKVTTGNLELSRDIGSLQDLLKAFQAIFAADWSEAEMFNTFNICSGTAKSLKVLAELLRERTGVNAEFFTDESLLRKDEPKVIVGDSKALQIKTGWKPTCKTEAETIDQFLAAI